MNDWNGRIILGSIPVLLAIGGWVLSLETRLQQVAITQNERTTTFADIKQEIRDISKELDALSKVPTPPAKILLDEHNRRIERLETRLNYMHEYIISLPVRPSPMPFRDKRGDLKLELAPRAISE